MSEDEERVRYDRQIRLWGKNTQQRLMKTHLHLYSIRGALAEVAKNLALAGVRAVDVLGHSPVRATDVGTNFLVQDGIDPAAGFQATDSLETVCVRSLRKLNPHVVCTAGPTETDATERSAATADGGATHVVLAETTSVADAAAVLKTHPTAALVVLTFHLGRVGEDGVLVLFLHPQRTDAAAQLARLLEDPLALAQRPASYQAAALALHLADARTEGRWDGTRADGLAQAVALTEALRLNGLPPEALSAAVTPDTEETVAVSVMLATQAGACIAQEIISFVGRAEASSTETAWMLCRASPVMETLVGA